MLYYGTITAVYPPGSKRNLNKYQYEYAVVITGPKYSSIPLNNVLAMDEFGSYDDYNDLILANGQKVCVMTFRDDFSQAIIVGAIRNSAIVTLDDLGRHWKRRFNAVEQLIDKDGNWSVKLDQGDNIQLNKQFISLNNSTGESVTIDKESKTITINAGADWNMTLGGNMHVTASGNVTLEAPLVKLGESAAEAVVRGDTFKKLFDAHQHIGNMGVPTTSPIMPLSPSALSTKVKTE